MTNFAFTPQRHWPDINPDQLRSGINDKEGIVSEQKMRFLAGRID